MPSQFQSKEERHRILPGYPWEGQFKTRKEIDEYLNQERITCLLCGKQYKSLGVHINTTHNSSIDEYKARFGLPWHRGLICISTRAIKREDGLKMVALGIFKSTPENLAKAQKAKHRPRQPFHNLLCAEHGALHGGSEPIWQKEHYEELLRRMVNQKRSPYDIADNDNDMPKRTALNEYRKKNPGYWKRLVAAYEKLPFTVQAKSQMMGKRFNQEVKRLSKEGFNQYEIAEKTGVAVMTVNRHLNDNMKFDKSLSVNKF